MCWKRKGTGTKHNLLYEGRYGFIPAIFFYKDFYALQRHESPSTGQKFRFHDSLLAAGKPQIPERLISSVLFREDCGFLFPHKVRSAGYKTSFLYILHRHDIITM